MENSECPQGAIALLSQRGERYGTQRLDTASGAGTGIGCCGFGRLGETWGQVLMGAWGVGVD